MYYLNVMRLHYLYTNVQYKYDMVDNHIFKNINTNMCANIVLLIDIYKYIYIHIYIYGSTINYHIFHKNVLYSYNLHNNLQ